MKYLFQLVLLFLFITSPLSLLAQQMGLVCGDTSTTSPSAPYGIPHLTENNGEALRVAIIYVTFKDDDDDGYGYTNWDKPTLFFPPEATQPEDSYLDDTEGNPNDFFMNRYSPYTLSDFFCEMSFGKFDVIGEEYSVIMPLESSEYKEDSLTVGELNQIVLEEADEQIDFTDYNNWSLVGGEWDYTNSDGIVDMIIICYRNVPAGIDSTWFFLQNGVGGVDRLRTWITLDGVTINSESGVTAIGQLYNKSALMQLMGHEFSHRFLDHENIGFMTAANTQTTYTYLPMEIERVDDWFPYTPPSNVTKEYILEDFMSTGDDDTLDVVKISQQGGATGYIWIANHQKVSEYQGITRGGKDCYATNYTLQDPQCSDGTGIYIYRVFTGTGSDCDNLNTPWDVISAEGRYDWSIDRTVTIPAQSNHLFPTSLDWPVIIPSSGDRIYGRDEYRKIIYSGTNSYHSIVNDDPCSSNSNDFWVTVDEKGDEYDAFNMGYNEILSPYSNPSIRSCLNSTTTYLTIALLGEDHGNINVKVYWYDDSLALAELPPSKPTGLIVSKEYVSTGVFYPKLKWDSNIEPDFILEEDPGEYKILKGVTTVCENEPTSYNLIATLPYDATEYVDDDQYLYDENTGTGHCSFVYKAIHYKIIAVDNNDDESLPSEKALITGYTDPCAEEDRPGSQSEIPLEYALKQNYPNPFNPSTNIQFDLPSNGIVTLKVYDMIGREVAILVNDLRQAGSYIVGFNGSNLASGVYYYKLKAGNFEETKRMVLIK